MLDRLAEIETKYEDLAEQINDPDVIANQTEWRKRMKEYSDMTPIVEKYREYKQAKEGIAESLAMLEEKQEEDFRELLKEELAENKEKAETLKQELTLLLIPKDPNDEKNVIMEIRGGAGGDADGDRRRADRAGSRYDAARPQRAGQTCRAEARRPGGLCARDGAGGAVGLSLCDGPDTAPRRTDYPCDCAHGGTMAQAKLKVILLRATPDPDELVALGARLCYAKADLDALQQRVESGDQRAFVERVMQRGHLSVTEHANFTFAVEGVSRALLAQLTRHRLASFSVQSQRYVSMAEGFDYVIPPAIEALGEDAKQEFIRQMETMQAWYCDWQEKLGGAGESANEDARFVLPNAAATRLVMTMNARELMHFFSLRCCNRAQWEIREMAWQMLALCKQAAPALFEHAGPACVSGPCPEGKSTCGKAAEVREKAQNL